MSLPPRQEDAIARSHDRRAFDCGEGETHGFLQRLARHGHAQNAVKTYCAVPDHAPTRVPGFYSLAPASVEHDAAPLAMTKGMAGRDLRSPNR